MKDETRKNLFDILHAAETHLSLLMEEVGTLLDTQEPAL